MLDISAKALQEVEARLGSRGASIDFLELDVLSWRPSRTFDLWFSDAIDER